MVEPDPEVLPPAKIALLTAPLVGHWRIRSMELWSQDHIETLGPALIRLNPDGTGEMTVLSENSRMPARGAHVRVKGKVNEVGLFGGQALGLHLREESLYIKR